MAKFDANKYKAEYDRSHYRQVSFRLPLYEEDVLNYISPIIKSKQFSKYIIQLIKDDMKNAEIIKRIKKS